MIISNSHEIFCLKIEFSFCILQQAIEMFENVVQVYSENLGIAFLKNLWTGGS